jgi:hypothetical protein
MLTLPSISESDKCRFYDKIKVQSNGCWNWTGNVGTHSGISRGKFSIKSQHYVAARISYKIHYDDPGDQLVLHKCDNALCVRPDHLYLGDAASNAADRELRGRRNQSGSLHPLATLTEEEVVEIKRLILEGKSCAEIARNYGVGYSCITNIKYERSWRAVPWMI